jgi:Glyoxalase-like domain
MKILAVLLILAAGVGTPAQAQQGDFPMISLKVDHASVCGAALAPMQQALAVIGLQPEYGGPHANGVTHMALLGFEDGSYLELIAPVHEGRPEGSEWAKFMSGEPRACAWAAEVEDIAKEVARLNQAGVSAAGPFPGSRKKPDGTILQWETAKAGPGTPGATLPFMIHDHTPRRLRVQPAASVQDSGLSGVAVVVLAVSDLEAGIALFRRAYGWNAPAREDHPESALKLAHFAGTPVMLASPLEGKSWLRERLEQFGDSPAAFLLGTRSYETVAKQFGFTQPTVWFGAKVGWIASGNLREVRLGIIAK